MSRVLFSCGNDVLRSRSRSPRRRRSYSPRDRSPRGRYTRSRSGSRDRYGRCATQFYFVYHSTCQLYSFLRNTPRFLNYVLDHLEGHAPEAAPGKIITILVAYVLLDRLNVNCSFFQVEINSVKLLLL